MVPSTFSRIAPLLCAVSFSAFAVTSSLQAQSSTPAKPAVSCSIRHTPVSPADIAFSHAKYAEAADLYRKESQAPGPEGERAHNALIRSLLRSGEVADADADVHTWAAKSPTDPWVLTSAAEVSFRKGDIDDAGNTLRKALAADFCSAQAHADYARYLSFTGYHASSKSQLDIAYKLDPVDDEIGGDWALSQPGPARVQAINAYMVRTKFLTDKERDSWQKAYDSAQKESLYPCKLASSLDHATIPMLSLMQGHVPTGSDPFQSRWGLGVSMNGSVRRLDIDTGASGLVLTHAAARSLNLVVETRNEIGGFGEGDKTRGGVARVKELRIGDLVFQNCAVEVLDSNAGASGDSDGLIGSDVFQSFLVTLDYPGRVVKLDPLPKLPDHAADPSLSAQTTSDAPASLHDRYIAPSMANWTKAFRAGHTLIIPVRMNNGPTHLFVVDTGNFTDLLSLKAAREVSKVADAPEAMSGLQGEDTHLGRTNAVTLDFAGLRKPSEGLFAANLDKFSRDVEIGGFLGIPTLHQLTIQIDYRDQLMKFTFDPSRVHRCAQGMVVADCY